MLRYTRVVQNGTKNPACGAVAKDVSASILRAPAQDGKPAMYRSKGEQSKLLDDVFQKYVKAKGIWHPKAREVRTFSFMCC